jgi:hypothetical protein
MWPGDHSILVGELQSGGSATGSKKLADIN